jgi:hypothetical protein
VPPPDTRSIDQFLASALRDDLADWPADWNSPAACSRVIERAVYHGIPALLINRATHPSSWPDLALALLRERAVAQAIWELRHRLALTQLLDKLSKRGVLGILLKGTAVAYDLYDNPADRFRGDTDLLVSEAEVATARKVLQQLGFRRSLDPAEAAAATHLQESWTANPGDGSSHTIDLHWQAFNTPALRHLLPWEECAASRVPLPGLAEDAFRLDHAAMLLHACTHSALHVSAPYFVDGETYYGGDRLIWAYDVHLLVSALSDEGWDRFCDLADHAGVGATCLRALRRSHAALATEIPERVVGRLTLARRSRAGDYLEARQLKRAMLDLRAMPSLPDKLHYVRARLFPSQAFMRAKYPRMARLPIALLHGRRIVDLFRARISSKP